jgi:hypothetical protein
MRRRRDRATAGFFEDIPALIVVTIGLGIFFSSAIYAFVNYHKSSSSTSFVDYAHDFADAVRSCPALLYDDNNAPLSGVYDYEKIQHVSLLDLNRTLNCPYFYSINITDVSDYQDHRCDRRIESATYLDSPIRIRVSLSATVRVDLSQYHASLLTVEVWQ